MSFRWLDRWKNPHQYRVRRAYFRPTDPSAVDPICVPLIETVVTVRFQRVGRPGGAFAGQRLYRILRSKVSRRVLRPEQEFDFLD